MWGLGTALHRQPRAAPRRTKRSTRLCATASPPSPMSSSTWAATYSRRSSSVQLHPAMSSLLS
uniref:Uncharacterized protein n=1 Tax=Oryza barthii TaxID=65489 RepID=A0A0D3HSZ0_9ORYZ